MFASNASPSCEGKTEIPEPGARNSEIFAEVPAKVRFPTCSTRSLIAANVAGVELPSKRTSAGKLNES